MVSKACLIASSSLSLVRAFAARKYVLIFDQQRSIGLSVRQGIEELITSEEADHVTPLMTKIYFRLLVAPSEWRESGDTLLVRESTLGEVSTTAWAILVNWLRVSPEEAHKALQWMNDKKVIHYQPDQSRREIKIYLEGLYFPD
jgi:hypothetical protein